MKNFTVLDTNVVVSGMLKPISIPGNILIDSLKGIHTIPVVSNKILDEYKEVIYRKKFNFNPNYCNDVIERIKSVGLHLLDDEISSYQYFTDDSDKSFYSVFKKAQMLFDDSYLVTGNTRHFPLEKNIVTPREMAQIAHLL